MFKKAKLQKSQYEPSFSSNEALNKMLFCINNNLPSTIFPELEKEPREIYNDTVMYSDDEDYIDVHEILDLDDAGEWRCEVDEYVNLEYDFQYKKKLRDLSKRDLNDEQFMLEYKRYRNVVRDRVENIKEMKEAEEEKLKDKEKKEEKKRKRKRIQRRFVSYRKYKRK